MKSTIGNIMTNAIPLILSQTLNVIHV